MKTPTVASTASPSPAKTSQEQSRAPALSRLTPPQSFKLQSDDLKGLPLPRIPGLTWTAEATFPPEKELSLDSLTTLPSGSQIVLTASEKVEGALTLPVQPSISVGSAANLNARATIKLEMVDGTGEGENLLRVTATLRGEIGGEVTSGAKTPWLTIPSVIRKSVEGVIDRVPLPSRLEDVLRAAIGEAPGATVRAGAKTMKEGAVVVDLDRSNYSEQFKELLRIPSGQQEGNVHPTLRGWWEKLSELGKNGANNPSLSVIERTEATLDGGIAVTIPTQSPLQIAEARQTNGAETTRARGQAINRLWREAQLRWFGTERGIKVTTVERGNEECACVTFTAKERPQLNNILTPIALARKLGVACAALAKERVEKITLPTPTLRQVLSASDLLHIAYKVNIGNDPFREIRKNSKEGGALKAYLKADGDLHQARSDINPRPIAPSLSLLDILEPDDNGKGKNLHAAVRAKEIFQKAQKLAWKLGGSLFGKEMRESYRALTGRDLDRDVQVFKRANEFQSRFDSLGENRGCNQGLNHLLLGFADTRRFCPFTPIAALVDLGHLSREDLAHFEVTSPNKEIDITIGTNPQNIKKT